MSSLLVIEKEIFLAKQGSHLWLAPIKEMGYIDVLKNPVYQKLICDEEWCDFFRYPN
jgi:hypothetical protein